MYTYILIDDDLFSCKILKALLETDAELIYKNSFSDSELALKYLNENEVDIIFLDIQMPKISGLELRDELKDNNEIIFTTSYSKYSLNAFDGNVTDYLVKPLREKDLNRALKKAKKNIDLRRKIQLRLPSTLETELLIKYNNKTHRILQSEILFIESRKEYLEYHVNGASIIVYGSLYKAKAMLQGDFFIQTHKSYVVNKAYIKQFNKKQITLTDSSIIPIGKSFSAEVNNSLLNIKVEA